MKSFQRCVCVFLFLSFLPLIAFSSTPPFPAITGIDGKELKLGEPYYVFSTIFPKIDGLCLMGPNNEIVQCPLLYNTDDRGLLVTFSAADQTAEDTVVRESIPYRIEFSDAGNNGSNNGNFCYIKNGGNPWVDYVEIGPENLAVEFVMKKVFLGYKIFYCIIIPVPKTPICYSFGFIEEFGLNRLGFGVGVNPVLFFFANVTTNSIHNLPARTGGGLTLRSTTRKFCPLGIFQEVKDDYPGIPISFYPVNPKKGVIRVSTDLNIDFPKNRVQCAKSNVWKVDIYDQYTKRFYIAMGGVKGNPGPKTINNWFKIEKYGRGYKLVHCPSVVQHKVMCKDVGVVKYNGQKRLALSDAPFGVMFKKA
nr:kunitz trypsin inhibitor 2 [Ipomoea batatas]